MRMTSHTDYAFRMLIYLATHSDGQATVDEIASRYALSRNHLLKVALHLKNAGFVKSIRGRSGGLRLGRPAQEINVAAVVRAMEQGAVLVECFRPTGGNCVISDVCRLKGVFGEAMQAYFRVLDRYSLSDLTRNADMLRSLLRQA